MVGGGILFLVGGVASCSCIVVLCRVGWCLVLWRRVVMSLRRVAACVMRRVVVRRLVVPSCAGRWLCHAAFCVVFGGWLCGAVLRCVVWCRVVSVGLWCFVLCDVVL